jgi:transcriptional regulator
MKYVIDNLMSSERKSQVDIAAEWGCSRQNVAMLEAKAKTLLRPLLADLV